MTTTTSITRKASSVYGPPTSRLDRSPTRPNREPAVNLAAILDVIEGLLNAAEHPDIVKVDRYGDGNEPWGPSTERSKSKTLAGVKVTHQSTATASLWGAVWPGQQPVAVPDVLPAPKFRAARLAILVVQLLDVARPAQFKAWQLVALPDLGPAEARGTFPAGVSITCADGASMLLRATSTGASVGHEDTEDRFSDYMIPEGVKQWHQRVSAVSAARG